MQRAEKLLWNYVDDDSAVTAIEYCLIASVISISIIMGSMSVATNLQRIFASITF